MHVKKFNAWSVLTDFLLNYFSGNDEMKKGLWAGLAVGVIMMGICGVANALSITVNDNNIDEWSGVYLNNSSFYGQFDISSALPQDKTYNKPYQVNNAVVTLYFQDNYDFRYDHTRVENYEYSHQYWDSYYYQWTNVYTRRVINLYYSPEEQATLLIDGQSSDNGTSYNMMYRFFWAGDRDDKSQVPDKLLHDDFYYYSYGWVGDFTIQQYLNGSALSDLSEDGIIGYSTWATVGDAILTKATLTVDVSPNPVPEPATMLLMGTGIAGLAGFRLRRKK